LYLEDFPNPLNYQDVTGNSKKNYYGKYFNNKN
jgi:hypothetical protein